MTIKEANDILVNPNKYYSHHKDDATDFSKRVVRFLYANKDNPVYEAIIDDIDKWLNGGENNGNN